MDFSYTFTVKATNAIGSGPPSSQSNSVTPSSGGSANIQIGNGPDTSDGSYINATGLADTLAFTSVLIQAANSITIVDPAELANSEFFGPTIFDLLLQSPLIDVQGDVVMGAGTFT
jgi:hypothetical protein